MGFYIDFEKMSLGAYRKELDKSNLIPSRLMLREQADAHFPLLEEHFKNVDELFRALNNKQSTKEIATQTGVHEEYLTVLLREIKGHRRNPIKIEKFRGLSPGAHRKLTRLGITTTRQLYNLVLSPESRDALALKAGLSKSELLMMVKLTDLTRVRWVNHNFAYALYESGIDTAEKVANVDPEALYLIIKKLNEVRRFFPAHIGLKDMERCVESANLLSFDIEY